jgi:heptosyltransferase I
MRDMRSILLVKTSSLGDVIHNLPVVSDIRRHLGDVAIDWVVEEPLAAIARMHPGVSNVIAVAHRRWRKAPLSAVHRAQRRAFVERIRRERYEAVIDTQGLLKSALIARRARGTRFGYDWASAREPLATLFYDRKLAVSKALHAVERNRRLAALALSYEIASAVDYGVRAPQAGSISLPPAPYAVLLHATSRADKEWPQPRWIELGRSLFERGITCWLPGGTQAERARSERLVAEIPNAVAAPALNLEEVAFVLAHAKLVVGVDTGLTHLACALGVPTVAIYCGSDPGLTGLYGSDKALNLGRWGEPPSVAKVLAAVVAVSGEAVLEGSWCANLE